MKEVIMEVTMELLFPKDSEGNYTIPEDFNPKTTVDGVNYIIKEENGEINTTRN